MHLECAYLLKRSLQDALGEIVTSAAEALQREGIAEWGIGGGLGDTLIYSKDTVTEHYTNTHDLERKFTGTYEEVMARCRERLRDLIAHFITYLEEKCGIVLTHHGTFASAHEQVEAPRARLDVAIEQLIAAFFSEMGEGETT